MNHASQVKVGLITVLFKSDAVLPGFIASIARQQGQDYHLYLIDNSPNLETDHLLSQLLKPFPHISYSYFSNEKNYGAAKGNNRGIAQAISDGCDYVILLNNDIEIPSDTLIRDMVHQAVIQNERLIIPKILFYDTRKIWMAGGKLDEKKGTTLHIGALEEDGPMYDVPAYFAFAPTTFMLIHCSVFQEVGWLDEKYFIYYEDTDLLYRASKKGYRIYYMPSQVVLHKESSTTGGMQSANGIFYMNRNRIYFIRKNFKGLRRWRGILYFLIDFLRLMKYYGPDQRKIVISATRQGFCM